MTVGEHRTSPTSTATIATENTSLSPQSAHHSHSLANGYRHASPGKRKRSGSEVNGSNLSQSGGPALETSKRKLESYESDALRERSAPSSVAARHPNFVDPAIGRPPNLRLSHGVSPDSVNPSPWSATSHEENDDSESELAEALQRESRNMDEQQRAGNGESRGISLGHSQAQSSDFSTPITTARTAAGVQVDTKRRKRVFSNRTKTGCQTCRKRKKKCDEAKPECNNCIRGGFVCEGYVSKATWSSKPPMNKIPVALQSKERGGYNPVPIWPSRDPYSADLSAPQAPDNGRARARPAPAEGSSSHDPPRRSWSSVTWQDQNQSPYAQSQPPANEIRQPPSATSTQPPQLPPQPQQAQSQPKETISAERPGSASASRVEAPHVQSSQNMMTSQSALMAQHTAHQALQRAAKTEKEKMRDGEYFHMYDDQLIDEREQCKAALYRYNSNALNPANGVSREERARMFRQILQPGSTAAAATPAANDAGVLGKGVFVEAAFTCEYGYNINIGDDVVIGHNCTILDSARVSIGSRSIIGPNVTIVCTNAHTDPNYRAGSQGCFYAKQVLIEEDTFIGANVTILPGVKIAKGSTVGAGTVVNKSVPPGVVVSGNPMQVKHGVPPRNA